MRLAVFSVSPPQVVRELAPADDAGYDGPGADADSDPDRLGLIARSSVDRSRISSAIDAMALA